MPALDKIFGPRAATFQRSLAADAVPTGAPVDFNPTQGVPYGLTPQTHLRR